MIAIFEGYNGFKFWLFLKISTLKDYKTGNSKKAIKWDTFKIQSNYNMKLVIGDYF